MKISLIGLLFFFLSLAACKSTTEEIKANKEKFIQVAIERSEPADISELADMYQRVKFNNLEGSMKRLGVNNIETIYETTKSSENTLDSVVVFTKSKYKIIYDFATGERSGEAINRNYGLTGFEKIAERLYMGKSN